MAFPYGGNRKLLTGKPNSKFSDTQTHGPYKYWHHKHEFHEKDGGTLIRDHIQYKLPFGILGNCLMDHWVRKDLENIFVFRKKKIQEIFNTANPPPLTEPSLNLIKEQDFILSEQAISNMIPEHKLFGVWIQIYLVEQIFDVVLFHLVVNQSHGNN